MDRYKGFSLIELMITVAIIGILSLMVYPSYNNYIKRTKLSEVITLMEPYKKEMAETLLSETNSYRIISQPANSFSSISAGLEHNDKDDENNCIAYDASISATVAATINTDKLYGLKGGLNIFLSYTLVSAETLAKARKLNPNATSMPFPRLKYEH